VLATLPFRGAGAERPALRVLAVLAVVALVAALRAGGFAVGAALAALGAELGVRFVAHSVAPWLAVAAAAGLVAVAELAFWASSLSADAEVEPAVVARRLETIAAAALLASGAALLTLLGGSL
jgi:hypothetical protein